MIPITGLKFKLFQSCKIICNMVNSKGVHRKPPKFRNEFAYKNNFKKVLENLKKNTANRIVSSDIVSGKHKNKLDAEDIKHSERNAYRLQKRTSFEYRGELLYGLHPVRLALLKNKRKFHQLFFTSANIEEISDRNVSHKKEIVDLTKSLNIPIRDVSCKELRYLVQDAVHQGVCLDASHMQLLEWKETECQVMLDKFPLFLVLDEILDPMNVGAIIRSAYYFGVEKIFTVSGNSCKMSPTVSKASSGALEIMDIYQIENLEYFIKVMKSQNWNIVSTKACNNNDAEYGKLVNVLDFNLKEPTILVLGNEGRGVSPVIQTLCNNFITIYPSHTLHKGIDSLNVSVATGVILHCLFNSWKDGQK